MDLETLRSIPIFDGIDDDGLDVIARLATDFTAPAGRVLAEVGQPGTGLFVIEEGTVEVDLPDGSAVELGPGEFFGEVEFFDGSPASAHAIAHSDCEILQIPHEDMRSLLKSHPQLAARFFWAFGRTLAKRLRETNQRMASLLAISRSF